MPAKEEPSAPPPQPAAAEMRLIDAGVRWLRTYVATTRNEKGQCLAATRFFKYIVPALGPRLGAIDGDHIREFRLMLEAVHELSPYTVTHVLSDLRCLLRWAVSANLIERSPFPPRVMPRIGEVPPRGFSERQYDLLMRLEGRMGFALRFLLGTGLRWAEACRATVDDLRGKLLEVAHTKSGRVRRVPLSPELLREIEEIAAASPDDRRLVPYAATSPGSFSRRVRLWSGILDFHVHRCRHTFAMRWLEAGGNLAILQQILGHRDLSTTMRYARVTDLLVEQEAARVASRQRG